MKVVCIGDSLTFGYGLNQKNAWFEQVRLAYEGQFVNVGVPGNTTEEMLGRFETDVMSQHPTHVLIMGGSNDVLLEHAIEDVLKRVEVMVQMVVGYGAKPILMAPPPINEEIVDKTWFVEVDYKMANQTLKTYSSALKSIAEARDVPFVDLYHHYAFEEWKPHYLLDGIHFKKEGHQLMAKAILSVLDDVVHPIKVIDVEETERLKYLQAYTIHYLTKSGRKKRWEMVSRGGLERLKGEIENGRMVSDGSVIFATNEDHSKVVLLKEYRVGAGRYVYMLPAGLADDGEDEKTTAVREFKEETGLEFEPVHVEPARYVSIGIINEKVSVVYGYYSGIPSKAHQADNEDAEIMILDRDQVKNILEKEEVTIRTALLLQDFFKLNPFFEKRKI